MSGKNIGVKLSYSFFFPIKGSNLPNNPPLAFCWGCCLVAGAAFPSFGFYGVLVAYIFSCFDTCPFWLDKLLIALTCSVACSPEYA